MRCSLNERINVANRLVCFGFVQSEFYPSLKSAEYVYDNVILYADGFRNYRELRHSNGRRYDYVNSYASILTNLCI